MNIRCYQVGGAVRDKLMGVRSKDLDYVCECESYDVMVEWIKTQGKIYLESPQFWTVRAHIKGNEPADYVLARKDGQYSDGRRPDSVSVGTLLDDLARRDFTMNAIAVSESGDYVDPFNGQADIKNKLIRCVGKAFDRFNEDALRLLRAIRFKIMKGFDLDSEVMGCLNNPYLADRLANNVSHERMKDELHRAFAHDTPATLVELGHYPLISKAVFGDRRIWLMPTMRDA